MRGVHQSGFYVSIASVTPDGWPHLAPVGSMMLGEPGQAILFQKYLRQSPRNWAHEERICIMGVNSSRWLWARALLLGRFPQPPGFRVQARVIGPPRAARPEEIKRFQRRVGLLRYTPGGHALWGKMSVVRDLRLEKFLPLQIGSL